MSSRSRQNQLRLASEIRRANTISPISCDHCLSCNIDCYVMPSPDRRLKCSECTRIGRPCVNLSWSSLDNTREEYAKKIEEDEKLLAEVMIRLLRNKKILKQAEERAQKKALCLASEIEESGVEVRADEINCPAADALVGFSPAMWSTLDLLESASSLGMAPTTSSS